MFFFEDYLDAWSRGSIFITRLPEFVFGICFAFWLFYMPDLLKKRLSTPLPWILCAIVYLAGSLFAFFDAQSGNHIVDFSWRRRISANNSKDIDFDCHDPGVGAFP